ncbi:MAG: DNA primase [Verrucomicrobiota bacterium]|nr:DNA primase [Verrucomicrobiota bacterium]
MAIPKEIIEEVRSRCDIVDLVSSYLPELRKRGATYKCCCPFHNEKTPSFTVNQERQIYHCFGCGANGDVFSFVQEYDKLDFLSTVQFLADRTGVKITYDNNDNKNKDSKDTLLNINSNAANFFHKNLFNSDSGKLCREYLKKRSLTDDVLKEFQIGFSPDGWEELLSKALKKGYKSEEIEKAGLVVKSKRSGKVKYYDRFRNRLMFPICDSLGRVIGFSGRILEDKRKEAKYVNSPETLIFHKSSVLFAFDKARKEIVEKKLAIVVEGQIDAMRCHTVGIKNVVASQGTALTVQHAKLIKRYADEVVLIFDSDTAGVSAALSTSKLFLENELSVRVATLPNGEDPDSLILKHGVNIFKKEINDALPALNFLIKTIENKEDQTTVVGRKRMRNQIMDFINRCPSESWKEEMIKEASGMINISVRALIKDLDAINEKNIPNKNNQNLHLVNHDGSLYPLEELDLLSYAIHYNENVKSLVSDYLPMSLIKNKECKKLIKKVINVTPKDIEANLNDLSEDERNCYTSAAAIIKKLDDDYSPDRAVKEYIKKLWLNYLRNEYSNNKNFEKRSQITKDANLLKTNWAEGKKIIVKLLEDM